MKSRVFKTAWQIASNFKTFAEALKHAWELVKLKYAMIKGVVKFTYKRVDGTNRAAVGTLQYVMQNIPSKVMLRPTATWYTLI